ncbi:MAG: FAD-binding oxidoreductase [Sphingobacteriaceae bacterium]|nr:FAD-binding oxidoreductase [Sphingobacteriaceae bacterium]
MLDLIIVGKGLAANTLALSLQEHQLSYCIIGDPSLSNCSRIAAGLWNPIVFKRMTSSWKADEFIKELKIFYTSAEKRTASQFYTERTIIKPFFSVEEKNFWIKKSQNGLSQFIDHAIYTANAQHKNLVIPDSYGLVNNCGNIDMQSFLNACEDLHAENKNEVFDHSQLRVNTDHIVYKNIKAKCIVFCEGHLVKNNPFFNWIPMNSVKGEVFEIEAEGIELEKEILNHNAFIFKLKDKRFKVGATYNWKELNDEPTENGANELKEKLAGLIKVPYNVLEHKAGVRPSTLDRRPIIGQHPLHKNLFVFNGLGTKGVMLAPYFSKKFVHFYLNKEALDAEVDVKRFYSKFNNG